MRITSEPTDQAILVELGTRLAHLRVQKNLSQADLAEASGVSKKTIERLERGEAATQLSGFIRVCRALGIIERFDSLVSDPAPSPIEQAKFLGRRRRRASSKRDQAPAGTTEWTWNKS